MRIVLTRKTGTDWNQSERPLRSVRYPEGIRSSAELVQDHDPQSTDANGKNVDNSSSKSLF